MIWITLAFAWTLDYREARAEDGSLLAQAVRNLPSMQETQVQSWGLEDPLENGKATHSSNFVGEIHGQRSMEGYSPLRHKELDTPEWLTHTHTTSWRNLFQEAAVLSQGTDDGVLDEGRGSGDGEWTNQGARTCGAAPKHRGCPQRTISKDTSLHEGLLCARGPPRWLSGKEATCEAREAGDAGLTPGPGMPLEEGMATHSRCVTWKIPRTEEPSGL